MVVRVLVTPEFFTFHQIQALNYLFEENDSRIISIEYYFFKFKENFKSLSGYLNKELEMDCLKEFLLKDMGKNEKNEIFNLGIATKTCENKIIFIHKTYAEYFLAKLIALLIKEDILNESMKKILFQNILVGMDSYLIRYFINYFLVEINFENLKESMQGFNVRDESSKTPTHYASEENNLGIIKYLKENGANLNALDVNHQTPIFYACSNGHFEIVKYLKESGGDLDKEDEELETPIFHASRNGHLIIIKYLTENSVNLHAKNLYSLTPIFNAVISGNIDIVKYLKEKGANLDASDETGKTPIFYASDYGHLEIVKYLKEMGADCNALDSK
ncbi:unnamed protein product [Brachionus calyciflorus]|uniref:Ankyrin repeat protein n=1 Tax=Brachionus calyciflorus TaxID=104777 RepID=A0A814E0E6_9BILA|nr:unnamed protein product [Brachionus calyciflorus]